MGYREIEIAGEREEKMKRESGSKRGREGERER